MVNEKGVNPIGPEADVNLWLDDIRDPLKLGLVGWTWVKTADEAIALLSSGHVRRASLDHDLTISQTLGNPDREKTGYDVVLWMEENNTWPPEGVSVHSMNPEGRIKMNKAVQRQYGT